MSKRCARGFAFSLAVLLLSPAVLAQEQEKKTQAPTTPKADCEPNNCISKVLYLPEFSTAGELQNLANMFRSILDFRIVQPQQSDHTIAVKVSPEQLVAAEKLLNVLEGLRSSGGNDRSSVLVYQFKGPLVGTARAEQMLAQAPRVASMICDLSTCYIKAMYLPDLSGQELYDFTNKLRTTAEILRTEAIPSWHVLVFSGTSEQVVRADEMLPMKTSAPQ